MLLTITTEHQPTEDLGFLLHKNPKNLHTVTMSFGKAYVFYPEITKERCTAALLLDIDPIGLVRKNKGNNKFALAQYVNDRPYVSSSFMSVAINKAFRTLLSGTSKHRQNLVDANIPLEIKLYALPCRGGASVLEKLFKPLGYEIATEHHALDIKFPDWGDSEYYTVTLKRNCQLKEFLTHLYVLIPVLDNEKHYYISDDEIEKLLRFGKGWLEQHPEKEMITRRYLKLPSIANKALAQLSDGKEEIVEEEELSAKTEKYLEENISLNEQRIKTILETLKTHHAKRVIDLGCGEGNLLKELLSDNYFEYITGCDVSSQALRKATAKLEIERLPIMKQKRISLMQTALTYRDKRLKGYDAATITEVIEHFDLARLDTFRRIVFEFVRPCAVIITTPNIEYNKLFENLMDGKFRHNDHRFEWTRKEFENWSNSVAEEFGYNVNFKPIGEVHPQYGTPTQMAVFIKKDRT